MLADPVLLVLDGYTENDQKCPHTVYNWERRNQVIIKKNNINFKKENKFG